MSDHSPAPVSSTALSAKPWSELGLEQGPDQEAGSSNLRFQLERGWAALKRRKWIVLMFTLLGTAGGVGAAGLVKLEYQAQSTFWVELGDHGAESRGPIRTEQLLQSFAWIELLKSFQVLDHVVRQERLYVEPASPSDAPLFSTFSLRDRFRPGKYELEVGSDGMSYALTSGGFLVEQGQPGAAVGEQVGFDWTPSSRGLRPGRTIRFSVKNPRDVATELGEDLQTRMTGEGNFLGLSLTGTDPERIASTLNAVADRYVELAAQLKRAKLEELTGVLDEQRRYAEQELREAEIALESFRVQTITLPSDRSQPIAAGLESTRNPVMNRFFESRIARERLRADREALDRSVERMTERTEALDALSAIPAVAESPALAGALTMRLQKRTELQSLQLRYTDEHPQVQRLDAELTALERQTIPQLALALRTHLADREAEMDLQLGSSAEELRQIPPRAIEEARLQRRVAIAENLHSILKQRYEEARLAAAGSIPDIRILDHAVVPYQPLHDRRPLLILLGFIGSLGLAIGGVVVLDRLDSRVRYPEQITGELGLPVLGLVPAVKPDNADAAASLRASEAFREIRLSLTHAHGVAGPVLLTISSAESGEGKSFVSSNLAFAFAEQGHKTLIIDGDVRRGRLHHLLQAYRSPGLTDFLAGRASFEEVIQPTSIPSVSLIASGTRMRQGPELLSSAAMGQLVVGLRSRFGVILIDSPPLGAGVDAYALSTITRNLLFVMRVGQTDRVFAEAKLDLLNRLPVRLLGTVLNCTPESRVYRNYYYLPGYEVDQEDAGEMTTRAQV